MAQKLPFGQLGEITSETIEAAGLAAAEKLRAYEVAEVQAAYLEILECLNYPVDPAGHVHYLSILGPTKVAVAYTLALAWFRKSGPPQIKQRRFTAPGCVEEAVTWVDARLPDTAAEELQPEHSVHDDSLPPDTRRLAAVRDGVAAAPMNEEWSVTVTVKGADE